MANESVDEKIEEMITEDELTRMGMKPAYTLGRGGLIVYEGQDWQYTLKPIGDGNYTIFERARMERKN
jgi:hypothetical protein